MRYFWNILISIDQMANTLLGGDPDETISSRAYKGRAAWYWAALLWVLDKIDPHHGEKSVEPDEGKDAVLKD